MDEIQTKDEINTWERESSNENLHKRARRTQQCEGAHCFIENEHDWETFKTGPCRLLKRKLIPLRVASKLPRRKGKKRKIDEATFGEDTANKNVDGMVYGLSFRLFKVDLTLLGTNGTEFVNN